jgi:penicillin-binding protein-related factor A (putative recombinase)
MVNFSKAFCNNAPLRQFKSQQVLHRKQSLQKLIIHFIDLVFDLLSSVFLIKIYAKRNITYRVTVFVIKLAI